MRRHFQSNSAEAAPPPLPRGSGQNLLDELSVNYRGAFGSAVVQEGHSEMIETHQMHDGGVQIMHVNRALNGAEADLVGPADDRSFFDSGAGHPHGEAPWIVVP